jgi:uncharacterized BrkB/YihY/UPF0761 family membrane protein
MPTDGDAGRPPAASEDHAAHGRVERARQTAARTVERTVVTAEAARRRSRVVDLVWTASERDRRAVGSVLAGALAFRIFVYLLPLFLALLTLVGLVVGLDEDAPTSVAGGVGLSTYVVRSVATASQQAHSNLWFLVPLSAWAVYSAGGATARVLHAVHTVAWGLPPRRMRGTAKAAGATFVGALAALVAVGISQWVRHESPGLGLVAALAGIAPFTLLWLVVSWVLPHDPRAPRTAFLPGALLMGTGVWLAHLFSVYFLAHRVDKASNLYGSLGVAAALLAWLYLFGRMMVAAAMLNATLWERRSGPPPDQPDGDAAPPAGPSA